MFHFTRKGFTLLEILVVMGIIVLLVGLGSVSYSTAQKKARDAKRRADLQAIRSSLEQYYSLCNFTYPMTTNGDLPADIVCGTNSIMDALPTDPKTGDSYVCIDCDATQSKYTICPPVVDTAKRMEVDICDTTNNQCCISNQQ